MTLVSGAAARMRRWSCPDPASAHRAELVGPEAVPEGIVEGVGDPGIESCLRELPALGCAGGSGERLGIVVRIANAKSFTGRMEKVLAVDEGNRAFGLRFWHRIAGQRDNPARAANGKSSGEQVLGTVSARVGAVKREPLPT